MYDCAGRGWSDATDGPEDGAEIAADLHTLLDRAQTPGPMCWPATPSAASMSRAFAASSRDRRRPRAPRLHRTQARTDPAHQHHRDAFSRVAALVPAIAHLGAGRLIAQAPYGDLPPRAQDEARANASLARNLGSYIDEFVEANTAMQQAATLTSLDGKPLIVLTADTGNDAGWQQKQDHMAACPPTAATRSLSHHPRLHDQRPRRLRRSQPGHPRRRRGGTHRPTAPLNPMSPHPPTACSSIVL